MQTTMSASSAWIPSMFPLYVSQEEVLTLLVHSNLSNRTSVPIFPMTIVGPPPSPQRKKHTDAFSLCYILLHDDAVSMLSLHVRTPYKTMMATPTRPMKDIVFRKLHIKEQLRNCSLLT